MTVLYRSVVITCLLFAALSSQPSRADPIQNKLMIPVTGKEVRMISGFGVRYHPLLKREKMHNGIDWSVPSGTPIIAAGNGTIEFAERKKFYGLHIVIRHSDKVKSTYSHLKKIDDNIVLGGDIKGEQVIGNM